MSLFNRTNKKKRTVDEKLLPTTYKQLYRFTYKTNWGGLIKLSLLMSIFAIPLVVMLIVKGVIENGIASNTELTAAEIVTAGQYFRMIYSPILFVGFYILSFSFMGAFNYLKRYLRGEGSKLARDFFKGIKLNWGRYTLYTLFFFGILTALNVILNIPYLKDFWIYMFITFIVLEIIFTCVYFICLIMSTIYKVKFFQSIKNSILIFFRRLPYAILMGLGTFGIWVICYCIPVGIVQYICMLCYICLLFANSALVMCLMTYHLFDQFVNKDNYPEAYRKGLSNEQDYVDEGFDDEFEGE